MENIILSRRYAKALFDLAAESNQIDAVYHDMELIKKIFAENDSLRYTLRNYIIKNNIKKNIVEKIFSGKITPLSLEFMLFLIRKERGKYIVRIVLSFIEIYREFKNITAAVLSTPKPADEETKTRIISILRQLTNKDIHLENQIDKKLIGGFRLFFDDTLYDASLFTKFQKLSKSFSTNIYEKSL